MSIQTKSVGGRGVSWRERETLDLLELWGEEKVQEALAVSHRNIDIFEKIAEQMVARGHSRTAQECRTKTKALRQEYKRVVAHNSHSGNSPVSCPFYHQLHQILRGDAKIKPRRMGRSLSFLTMEVDPRPPENNVTEGSEEVFRNEVVTIKLEDIGSSTPSDLASSPEDHSSDLHSAPESSQCVEDHRNGESGESVESEECSQPPLEKETDDGQELTSTNCEPTANTTAPSGNGQGRNVPELSPAIRLANARNRKRRVALLSEVAERMLTQCSTEEREANRRHKETLDEERRWRRELMEEERRRHNQLIEEARQDRQVFKDVMTQNMTVMLSAVQALNSLTQMIAEKQQEPQTPPQTAATLPLVQEALFSPHEPHQKCPCAGRKNTR